METKKDYSKLEKEDLIKIIEKLESRKRYGLVWDEERIKEQFEKDSENALPVLKEVKSKEIKTNPKTPINILIEGDNYHALSVLNYTHLNTIDVIYIDPPYNTGNQDFVYNDKYVDKDDSYRHSKWLSFMSKRLRLAKNLLKDDGVIFISIDDNEFAQLKILCDEIFGQNNFVASIIWQKVYSPKNQSKRMSNDHEYVFAYAKNIDELDFSLLPRTEKMNQRYKNTDNDPRGPWKPGDLVANEERKNGHYIIKGPHGNKFNSPSGKHWAFQQETMEEMLRDNRVYFGKNGKAFPSLKQFLTEVQQGRKASTLFMHDQAGHTDEAKKELKMFFEQSDSLFSTPKPTRLIRQLLLLVKNKNGVVLDFMAGSGTTAQAVLELNEEDGGFRKFILCTNNESNICSAVCYPRIESVIKGYKSTKGTRIDGTKGNLKYFKTSFVKKTSSSDQLKINITNKCTEMLCLKEGVFDLIEEEDDYKIFRQGDRTMAVYYSFLSDSLKDLKKKLDKITGFKTLYCFTLDSLGLDKNNFIGWDDVALEPIPQKILDVYEEIYEY